MRLKPIWVDYNSSYLYYRHYNGSFWILFRRGFNFGSVRLPRPLSLRRIAHTVLANAICPRLATGGSWEISFHDSSEGQGQRRLWVLCFLSSKKQNMHRRDMEGVTPSLAGRNNSFELITPCFVIGITTKLFPGKLWHHDASRMYLQDNLDTNLENSVLNAQPWNETENGEATLWVWVPRTILTMLITMTVSICEYYDHDVWTYIRSRAAVKTALTNHKHKLSIPVRSCYDIIILMHVWVDDRRRDVLKMEMGTTGQRASFFSRELYVIHRV